MSKHIKKGGHQALHLDSGSNEFKTVAYSTVKTDKLWFMMFCVFSPHTSFKSRMEPADKVGNIMKECRHLQHLWLSYIVTSARLEPSAERPSQLQVFVVGRKDGTADTHSATWRSSRHIKASTTKAKWCTLPFHLWWFCLAVDQSRPACNWATHGVHMMSCLCGL